MADTMQIRFTLKVDGYVPGDVEEMEESEALRYIDGRCAVPTRGGVEEVADAPQDGLEEAAWDLKMGPEEYLERYPDGPNAEQARRIVEG